MRSDKHDTVELMVDKQKGFHGEYYVSSLGNLGSSID